MLDLRKKEDWRKNNKTIKYKNNANLMCTYKQPF